MFGEMQFVLGSACSEYQRVPHWDLLEHATCTAAVVLAREDGPIVVHWSTASAGAADLAFVVVVGIRGGIVGTCCHKRSQCHCQGFEVPMLSLLCVRYNVEHPGGFASETLARCAVSDGSRQSYVRM